MSKPPRPFTPAEDAVITAQWSRGLLADLAPVLGRDAGVIATRAREFVARGVLEPSRRFYQPPWSEADEDLLRELLGAVPLRAIAKRLGRTETAVRVHMKRAGLNQRDQFLTMRTVARVMDVDDHLVRRWIDDGLLRARPGHLRYGANHVWRCEVEDLERFIRRHPERYHYRRVCEEPFRTWARQVHDRDPLLTTAQAARELQVCATTVRKHLRNGWLKGVRAPRNGGPGTWLVRRSELAGFESRNPATTGVVVLRSVAGVRARRRAMSRRLVPLGQANRPRVQTLQPAPRSQRPRFQPTRWRAS